MIYTKTTGKFIGECMTGFGVSHAVDIYNYGNSQVKYTITSDDSNFSSSVLDLTVNNGSKGEFDIYFHATSTNTSGYESGVFTIASESAEDGSSDQSGDIYLYITGHRIVDTTGGHVRNFRALRRFDLKGPNYDFYWFHPTGTGNLYNYFLTGYQLDISTNNSFTQIVKSKSINVSDNTPLNPKYGTYNGISIAEQTINIADYNNGNPLEMDTDYFARIYSITDNGVTGISVFATGINSYTETVSEEVITGNVSNVSNIKFSKKSLDLLFPDDSTSVGVELYPLIVEAVGGDDLKYISGINIYFGSNVSFLGGSETTAALNLEGTFKNFTGNPQDGTNINLYLHETTKLYGLYGQGGRIDKIFQQVYATKENQQPNAADFVANTLYGGKAALAKNGGDALKFKITSVINGTERKDLNCNIFSTYGASIFAGGAGTDASVITFDDLGNGNMSLNFNGVGKDKNQTFFRFFFTLEGHTNFSTSAINSIVLYRDDLQIDPNPRTSFFKRIKDLIPLGTLNSYPVSFGEDANATKVPYWKADGIRFVESYNALKGDGVINYAEPVAPADITWRPFRGTSARLLYAPIRIPQSNYPLAGKIVNANKEAKINFNFSDGYIPPDYFFRFDNAGISAANNNWKNTTNQATLAGSTVGSIFNNALYSFAGKNSVTLSAQEYLQSTFSSLTNSNSKDCKDFDLILVVAYRPVVIEQNDNYNVARRDSGVNQYAPSRFKILDWFDTLKPNQITKDQILITNFPGYDTPFLAKTLLDYPKEPNIFQFFINPLVNGDIITQVNPDIYETQYLPNPRYELFKRYIQRDRSISATNVALNNAVKNYQTSPNQDIQLSKSLLNATDYYPMILNIRRSSGVMSIFVNNRLLVEYDLGNFITYHNSFIMNNISNSTLKLISNCIGVTGGNKESMSYFDIIFYNRNLSQTELAALHTNLIKNYLKLFVGSSSGLNFQSDRVRLPNIFNLAGRKNL